ncbi:MAG TPA: tetraacyldisaccharide 4'-kinase [Arenimonas sp.]|nr:tetraacyldisaccharide 4'-kinase [Arenimonas sp.]
MSARLERWLLQRWYGGVAPGAGLRLLSLVYRALWLLRDVAYRLGLSRSERVSVPVIVIGNLVAGGSGKTPLCIALARHLAASGWRPGVVSRGYGRRSRDPLRVTADSTAADCGDEPLLIAQRTGLPVQVDRDRVAAARALIADGCNLILADDGLQHRRLARDIEIEVVDGERRYGNGQLLPAGPLRELAGRAVDFRVVNGDATRLDAWSMHFRLGDAQPLHGGAGRPLAAFAGKTVHAIAGIGNPGRFFSGLRALGLDPVEHAFPDHHAYRREELQFFPPAPLLMTEKDAVKCRSLALQDAWVVPVEAELPESLLAALDQRLSELRPDVRTP